MPSHENKELIVLIQRNLGSLLSTQKFEDFYDGAWTDFMRGKYLLGSPREIANTKKVNEFLAQFAEKLLTNNHD